MTDRSSLEAPALLVLAAGLGSRYGGLKQLDGVGPNGETLLEYSIYDALQEGFGKVVLVIRKDIEEAVRTQIVSRFADRVEVEFAYQELDALPAGFSVPEDRKKPWGTGHAILVAKDNLPLPFGVINADDYYGRGAFRELAGFLRSAPLAASPARFCMMGYRLANTLSEHGSVSRGICAVNENGLLQGIEEHTEIVPENDDAVSRREKGEERLDGQTLTSMNLFGFTPDLFPILEGKFERFLQERIGEEKAEFYIPSAVSEAIREETATVKVLPTEEEWMGVTYPDDRDRVVEAISRKIRAGHYPEHLFQS